MNNMLFKKTDAIMALKATEEVENMYKEKNDLIKSAKISLGGSALLAIASAGFVVGSAPVALPVLIAGSIGALFINTLKKMKKATEEENKNDENKKFVMEVLKETTNQIDTVQEEIREYRDLRKKWNEGAIPHTEENAKIIESKKSAMEATVNHFHLNKDNVRFSDDHAETSWIESEAKELLSKNALKSKIQKQSQDSQEKVENKSKFGFGK